MQINFAHLREPSTSGGWVNFAVFDARATSSSDTANAQALAQLLLRPSEVLSGIANPPVLKVAKNALRSLLQHSHMRGGRFA